MAGHRPDGRTARRTPLTGRRDEQRLLADLLAGVRDGVSAALVLRGEPGIGKTRLLDHTTATCTDLRVLTVAGVESEMHLGFAALHRLLRPFLPRVDALPAPQREALRSAFGLAAGPPADRYLIGIATLTLLADAATPQPLLCVVDDAHWLDRESAEALAFAARRLLADTIGIIIAGRPDTGPCPFAGLPTTTMTGLAETDARDLLSAVVAGHIDTAVAGRIVAETGGNPLALTELAAGLGPEQLAGLAPLPAALPVGTLLEEHFRDQVGGLPPETQTLLLVLSATPPEDPALLWSAAGHLGIPAEAADPALSAGILIRDPVLGFRHPLIRSAVYLGAAPAARRRAHDALAAVSDSPRDRDRRAWHRAEATAGLDERVAAELEAASERARSRGGYAGQAAFLSRAAELSPDARDQAARRVAAARAYLVVGDPVAARTMLDRAEHGLDRPVPRARAQQARATVELYFNRITVMPAILLSAAESVADLDARLARELMFEAVQTALITGDRSDVSLSDIASAALASPAMASAEQTFPDLFLKAYATRAAVGYRAAVPLLREALTAVRTSQDLTEDGLPLAVISMFASDDLWEEEAGREVWRRLEEHDRHTGALGSLQTTLSIGATWELRAGRFEAADALLAASVDIANLIGVPRENEGSRIEVMAWRGDPAETRRMAAAASAVWTERIEGTSFGDYVMTCLAVLEISLGRYTEALACALPAFESDRPAADARTLHEIVEAGVRSGDHRAAKAALTRLEERAPVSGTAWALGLLARCRALMADDDHAEPLYREAVALLGRTRIVTELARAHLLYGEWLRRKRRRADARVELRTAYGLFTEMGAMAFAERARAELSATGERPRSRAVRAETLLTPQETQVAELAASGATNAEIAVRLFITTSTVEYHLNKVFRKLDITSRRRLSDVLRGREGGPTFPTGG